MMGNLNAFLIGLIWFSSIWEEALLNRHKWKVNERRMDVDTASYGQTALDVKSSLTYSAVYLCTLLFIPSSFHCSLALVSFRSSHNDLLETLRKWLGNSGHGIVVESELADEFFIWDLGDGQRLQTQTWPSRAHGQHACLWVSIKDFHSGKDKLSSLRLQTCSITFHFLCSSLTITLCSIHDVLTKCCLYRNKWAVWVS